MAREFQGSKNELVLLLMGFRHCWPVLSLLSRSFVRSLMEMGERKLNCHHNILVAVVVVCRYVTLAVSYPQS